MSNRTLQLTDPLYKYLIDHSLRESEPLRKLRTVTQQHEMARMQIAPEQGQFMALIVELIEARQIIEVGTFTGYSALAMAQALPQHGQIICCDISKEWSDIGKPFWEAAGVSSKIDLRLAPALETLDSLLANGDDGKFDMAFVDADKINYLNYYEKCLQLLRPGGMLVFDNTLWNGDVADISVQDDDTVAIRALNDQLHQDDRITLSLVPIGDGLTLVRKRK